MLTLITPTADQPMGIRLCEQFMQRQTLQAPIQWIVVDDGIVPAKLTMGQLHVRRDREHDCTPAQSLARNLLAAIPLVQNEVIVFIEHDDHYQPNHLETIVSQLNGSTLIAGDDQQRYYNVAQRCWRIFQNKGASLCQTAMRQSMLPLFEDVVRRCLAEGRFCIDFMLWQRASIALRGLRRTDTVLGIKGLPGRPGIGIGHRPVGPQWTKDPDFSQLRSWIGNDASLYESLT